MDRSLQTIRIENAKFLDVPYYEKSDIGVNYVRYADDFLIGLRGKEVAKRIVQEIVWFCEGYALKMQINPENSGIRHVSDGVIFLGYKLFLNRSLPLPAFGEQRAKHTRMMFGVPIERLLKRYAEKGFVRKRKGTRDKYVARYQTKFVGLPPYLVITRYNAVVRGLVNYYRGSERLSYMGELLHILRKSAALTLAHQQKSRSASYAFKRWGKNLTVSTTDSKQQPLRFEIPSLAKEWKGGDVNELTRRHWFRLP